MAADVSIETLSDIVDRERVKLYLVWRRLLLETE